MGKFLSVIGHFAFTVSLKTNNALWSPVIGHVIRCVNMPDRVSDVSIFRDTEQLIRSGDGMEVRVKTVVEVSVWIIFGIIIFSSIIGYIIPGFHIFSSMATFKLNWLMTRLLALFFRPLKLSLLSRQY